MESFETIMSRNNTTTTTVAAQRRSAEDRRDDGHATANTRLGGSRPSLRLTTAVSVVLCLCLILSTAAGASPVHSAIRRAIASGSDSTPKICHHHTPCGWAIYIPFTRRIDYFMKNTCDCEASLACIKTDDDLSVNAYVYRCRIKPRTTTETPTTT